MIGAKYLVNGATARNVISMNDSRSPQETPVSNHAQRLFRLRIRLFLSRRIAFCGIERITCGVAGRISRNYWDAVADIATRRGRRLAILSGDRQ